MGTNYQLGTGEEDDVWSPVQMTGKQLENRLVLAVSSGGQHTVLLVKDKEQSHVREGRRAPGAGPRGVLAVAAWLEQGSAGMLVFFVCKCLSSHGTRCSASSSGSARS
ncbi:Regulator of chromosome condensation-like protein [Aix galericulata]|nr:Regulator of chromosome condensation-like protein [Aix galericulata]